MSDSMQISVKLVTGKSVLIDVQPSDSTENVKAKVHAKMRDEVKKETGNEPGEEHNEDSFYLIHNGKKLEDGRAVSQYNLQNLSTLHVVGRGAGGGEAQPPGFADRVCTAVWLGGLVKGRQISIENQSKHAVSVCYAPSCKVDSVKMGMAETKFAQVCLPCASPHRSP